MVALVFFICLLLFSAAVALDPKIKQLKEKVEHIVIFMQENRAYDHYYGTLKGVRGFDDRAATLLPNGKPVWYQPTTSNSTPYMLPWHMDFLTTNGVCGSAPTMSYPCDIDMWNKGRMDQWNTARDPGLGMSYLQRTDMPFYYALADGFTICDQYFQSTMTATNPNRLHLFSGSNGLSVGHFPPALDDYEPHPGWNWTTMAEILEKEKISWRVYQEWDNFDDNGFAWFNTFQQAGLKDWRWEKGLYRANDFVDEFEKDIASGKLPQVSWLVGPTNASEHANNKPPLGEHLSARLMKVLQKYPETYKKTLFFLNYDEGGQFFDHHWPPTPPVSPTDGKSTVSTKGEVITQQLPKYGSVKPPTPNGLGFRVPAFMISPWSRGGYVNSQVFDHTSVIQLIEKRFDVYCPNVSPWRRAVVGDLLSMVDFDTEDLSWPDLPDTSHYTEQAIRECATLPPPHVPSKQSLPHQEPGSRPSRALPYELSASAHMSGDHLHLVINNTGSQGAAFLLFDHVDRSSTPLKYTVEAHKNLTDEMVLHGGKYNYTLHGVNGWVRLMASNHAELERDHHVSMEYDPANQNVVMVFHHEGTQNHVYEIIPNAYFKWEKQVVELNAETESPVRVALSLKDSHNWYDFTVQRQEDALGLVSMKRFMGRMETGVDSISDPAMGTFLSSAADLHPHQEPHSHPDIPHELSARKSWDFIDPRNCEVAHITQK